MSPISTRPFWIWLGRKVGIPKAWIRTDAERASTLRRSEGARKGWVKRKANFHAPKL